MVQREDIQRRLMATFQAELEEHLDTLNKGLLALEEGVPTEEQESLVADLFRAAHSVKGSAGVVGLSRIQTIAHRLEDVLGAIQRGELTPTPALFDQLFPAVDAMGEAMAAHLRGESLPAGQCDVVLAGLEAALRGEAEEKGEKGKREKGEGEQRREKEKEGGRGRGEVGEGAKVEKAKGKEEGAEAEGRPVPSAPPPPPPASPPPQEETIRVATAKLDALMAGLGELLVARMRTEQRLTELRALQQQVARWQKSWRQVRTRYNRLLRQDLLRLQTDVVSPFPELERLAQEMVPLLDFLALNEQHLKALHSNINQLVRRFTSDYNYLALLTDDLQDGVRQVRMRPVATLFDAFPRMVRDLARERGKEVTLQIEGADTEVDRQVLEAMKDPLVHLLRNAVDHGIEPPGQREAAGKPRRGTIFLRAAQKGNTVVLEVADDGAGIDPEAVRRAAVERGALSAQEAAGLSRQETLELIFRSGLSTQSEVTDISGRGVGLDVVRENLERLHGLIEVDTVIGQGTTFTLTLPLTLATSQVLLVAVAGQTVAVPTTTVERILRIHPAEVGQVEGQPAIRVDGRPLPLVPLAQVLELPPAKSVLAPDQKIPIIVLGVAERRVAFRVEELQGTQEVVIKGLGRQLKRVRNVAGATILGSGQVVVILNVADLMKSVQGAPAAATGAPIEVREVARRRVLVVDDSITTRTLEKNILENAGYDVLVAADGEEAWALVQSESLDAVVADVAMPRMDGFALTERVKRDERFKEMPVVLVTSLESPQDKIRGLEAGADAYITKGTFDQQDLLETLARLIG